MNSCRMVWYTVCFASGKGFLLILLSITLFHQNWAGAMCRQIPSPDDIEDSGDKEVEGTT
jgi:hypothetical protein